jgi:sugar lactone lactonase YvrE
MKEYRAELAVHAGCLLGEGPIWDAGAACVYWTDVTGKRLHRWDPVRREHRALDLHIRIGSFAVCSGNNAIAAGECGFHWLNLNTGVLSAIIDPEDNNPFTIFNDGKCDPMGRFLAGSSSSRLLPEGALYIMHTDGSVNKLVSDVGCSNGIAWSLDFKTMYYVDSLAYELAAFDYDLEEGEIANKRTVIAFPDTEVLRDGMTWDREGMLWIAEWGAWNVSRWNPRTGERLAVVHVPARFVTSCIFAGEGSDELYITTARRELEGTELADQPHAGGLFRVRTGIGGAPAYRFGTPYRQPGALQ